MSNNNLCPFGEMPECPECGEEMECLDKPDLEVCDWGNEVVSYQWYYCPCCDEVFKLTVEYSRAACWFTKND